MFIPLFSLFRIYQKLALLLCSDALQHSHAHAQSGAQCYWDRKSANSLSKWDFNILPVVGVISLFFFFFLNGTLLDVKLTTLCLTKNNCLVKSSYSLALYILKLGIEQKFSHFLFNYFIVSFLKGGCSMTAIRRSAPKKNGNSHDTLRRPTLDGTRGLSMGAFLFVYFIPKMKI